MRRTRGDVAKRRFNSRVVVRRVAAKALAVAIIGNWGCVTLACSMAVIADRVRLAVIALSEQKEVVLLRMNPVGAVPNATAIWVRLCPADTGMHLVAMAAVACCVLRCAGSKGAVAGIPVG